ncbi:hypothetical protein DAPPUDRAFT_105551 [Daphnia pulex]|uniref:Uncharacterized protein n=1 Tax=Daphnia pulex TaxID=6669 RepID=E9GR26_DAPPU|nr:hypothetical protein DAPPUDRAFT_105551 [Daphnia pulex]|eukprot:EFX77936.1 hypothetical protein DAPPUDRAFT_105551 [Daphnia pulex]
MISMQMRLMKLGITILANFSDCYNTLNNGETELYETSSNIANVFFYNSYKSSMFGPNSPGDLTGKLSNHVLHVDDLQPQVMKEDLAMAKPNLEDEIERKDLKKDLETSVSKHDLEVVFGEYGPLEHIKTKLGITILANFSDCYNTLNNGETELYETSSNIANVFFYNSYKSSMFGPNSPGDLTGKLSNHVLHVDDLQPQVMKEDLAMAKPNLEDEIERKDLKKDLETSVSKHDLEVVFGEYGPLEHIKTFHGD